MSSVNTTRVDFMVLEMRDLAGCNMLYDDKQAGVEQLQF
jgi:hypothetical protein